MKPRSRKEKGRRLQNFAAKMIRDKFGLAKSDAKSAIMGETGMDVKLSEHAANVFPFAVECKNTEKLNIWEALSQAERNSEGLTPLLIFKKNRSKIYCTLEFNKFLDLLGK